MSNIFTIPKAGTTLMYALMEELAIPVRVGHYVLPTNQIGNKNVVVIRDLRDVVCAVPFWVDQIASGRFKDHPYINHPNTPLYSKQTESQKLLQCISIEGLPYDHMKLTEKCVNFILNVMKKEDTLVIHFEDIIGKSAGGHLSKNETISLLDKVCNHISYPRSRDKIEQALEKVWGNTVSYNPVKKKVHRWKDMFNDKHKEHFIKIWDKLNVGLGYPSITNLKQESLLT